MGWHNYFLLSYANRENNGGPTTVPKIKMHLHEKYMILRQLRVSFLAACYQSESQTVLRNLRCHFILRPLVRKGEITSCFLGIAVF